MDRIPMPKVLSATLRRYNYWCMGLDRQQMEFNTLMASIDHAITLGMSRSEVVSLIGEPRWSDTRSN
jgi:hypothetical protein